MVGHDDAVVHGEVRDNLLLVVDLLLVVQHEVLFFLILLLPLVPLFSSGLAYSSELTNLLFKLHLSQSQFRSQTPITPVGRGFGGIMAYALSTSTSCAGAEPAEPFFRITQVAWKLTCCSRS